MNSGWYLRLLLVLGLVAGASYILFPSYYFFAKATEAERDDNTKFCSAMPTWMHCKKLNLGLDLQGGVHLVMGVEVEKAVEQRADRLADALREGMKEEKLAFTNVDRPRDTSEVVVTLAPDASVGALTDLVQKDYSSLEVQKKDGNVVTFRINKTDADFVREEAVNQAIKVIRNRADRLGVTEPTIAKRGADNILIQLPGVKDPQRAIDIIGRTAQLAFHIVDAQGTAVFQSVSDADLPPGVVRREGMAPGPNGQTVQDVYFELPEGRREAVEQLLTPKLPANRILSFGEETRQGVGTAEKTATLRTYVLDARPGITGDYLTSADPSQDPEMPSRYNVVMTFDQAGAKVFEKLTEDNVQRQMAIVLDGKVNSAPTIQEKIGGGTARITLGGNGRSQMQEARDLALVLKAGALPAPVEIREKREVGKTLGQEAVEKGSLAAMLGGLLVIIWMALYYKGSGLIADIGLALNFFFMMAILALFEATLTLPGIAGIALTLSMAVDANVIIFERIREEMRVGKTPRAAIEAGYDKAYSAIVDSNITTLIAGVVLMQYGSGPVRGFAVTLIVGLTCSMFTAIFCTRLIYDFFTSRRRLQTLSI